MKALEFGSPIFHETRYSWKYGCSRGISGAPIYLANGVVVDGSEAWGVKEW